MPLPSRALPRLAVAGAALTLGAATLAVAPGSSATVPLSGTVTATATTGGSTSSCSESGGGNAPVDVPYAPGHTMTQHTSNSATWTSTTNPTTDTVSEAAAASVTASSTVAGGTLSSLHVTGSGSASINASKGTDTDCSPKVSSVGGVQIEFTLTSPRWVTTSGSTSNGRTDAVLEVVDDLSNPSQGTVFIAVGKGTAGTHAYLLPGDYTAVAEGTVGGFLNGSTFNANFAATGSYSVSATFRVPGTATTGARGDTKVASLPAALSCSTHRATITWGKDAAKAGKATVKVNGKKPSTTKKPKQGKTRVVAGLPASGPVTLSVTAGSKSVSRTYEACA